MKLNHLSLAVPDVSEAGTFLETFFGFKTLSDKGNVIRVMQGDEAFILVLTTLRSEDHGYPADFHFGFILDMPEAVNSVYERLLAAGHALQRPPARIRNSLAFYFHMPGEILMEVSCNL